MAVRAGGGAEVESSQVAARVPQTSASESLGKAKQHPQRIHVTNRFLRDAAVAKVVQGLGGP